MENYSYILTYVQPSLSKEKNVADGKFLLSASKVPDNIRVTPTLSKEVNGDVTDPN